MRKILVAAALLFLYNGILFAQEEKHPIDIALDECLSIDSNQSTFGMVECIGRAHDAWDAEMNLVYGELMASLDSAGQSALREAQRAWMKYRDAEIELCAGIYYGNLEGTMYRIFAANRVADIVRSRALELAAYLNALTE